MLSKINDLAAVRKIIITLLMIASMALVSKGQGAHPVLKNAAIFGSKPADGKVIADTTTLLMQEDAFWKLIERSRLKANNQYKAQPGALKEILQELEARQIEMFNNRFISLLALSFDNKLWGASYVINGGCSDDCFDYFREYLIGHGKEKFYQTLKDPESCVSWIKSEEEESWEGLRYAAPDAYKQKTGKEIPPSYKPKFELKGKPFDEETVIRQYPKLARKFMGGN